MRMPNYGSAIAIGAVLAASLGSAGLVAAQGAPQVINIPLSLPGEPLQLEIDILSADIEVIGEDRTDVEISVTGEQATRKIITPTGSQPISGSAYSLEVDEKDNRVTVDTDWRSNTLTIVARVPRRSDLDLGTTNEGSIVVTDIDGKLQLENVNGPITAMNISGSVIAETVNEDISISFSRIDTDDAMALISINGNLSLGLPASAGAQLHIDSADGEIYSDFEVEVLPSTPTVERKEKRGGIEVRVENAIIANVNGGGPVIKMKTLNGDIEIRQSGN